MKKIFSWLLESNIYKPTQPFRCKKTGVYVIVNNIDGSMYVGSAKNIGRRFRHHVNYIDGVNGATGSYNLREAAIKYGIDNFSFVVLETCKEDELLEREKYWMDKLRPTYNVCLNPINSKGAIAKERMKPKCLWKPYPGHPQSDDVKRKISKTMKGRCPTRECINKSAEIRRKKVILEYNNGETKLFESVSACANFLGLDVKQASYFKQRGRLYLGKFRIKDYV